MENASVFDESIFPEFTYLAHIGRWFLLLHKRKPQTYYRSTSDAIYQFWSKAKAYYRDLMLTKQCLRVNDLAVS